MERRNNSVIVLMLAAFAGMFTFMPRATESTPPPSTTLTGSSNAAASSRASPIPAPTPQFSPALQMIEEFYHGGNPSQPTKGTARMQSDWAVDSIIAAVPDPVESALGNQFDNFLDAIQRALADSHYALDRFRNPWPLPAAGGESFGAYKKGSYGGADSDTIAKPAYATEPGMMLFRDSQGRRLMVVFLVGETPTRGIHKSAFKNALGQALEIANAHPSIPPADRTAKGSGAVIKAMGPSFSGSADSMKFALDE